MFTQGANNFPMNLTVTSEPKIVLEYTRPILIPIFEALEVATPKAHRIITENGWGNSPQLFSHIVRADTKLTLDGKYCALATHENTIRVVNMNDVAMEGLSTSFDKINLKILKGTTLPPAATDARRFFYQQELWEENDAPLIGSLVVLWHCNLEGSGLQLDLVCPKNTADWYWQEKIPHPAEWPVQTHSGPQADDNFDDLLKPDVDKKKKPN
jgi:hypothetical protein